MGCDGGSIPKRAEMVKTKQKEEKADSNEQNILLFTTCSLSKQPLEAPIVSCQMGRLYNRSSIIEFLLERTKFGENIKHIKKLNDVTVLDMKIPYTCPITKIEFGKGFCFFNCGHVVHQKAINEVGSESCLVCGIEGEAILINPQSGFEIAKAVQRVQRKKRKAKDEKAVEKKIKTSNDAGDMKAAKAPIKIKEKINANHIMPDIKKALEIVEKRKEMKSISSLYETKPGLKETFLTKGCFNRYATGQ